MKKIIKSALFMVMMALTFASCEDVPAPYNTDYNNGGNSSENVEPAGEGTLESPFNVAKVIEVIKAGNFDANTNYYIKGYVTTVTEISTSYGNATYDISDTKGGTTTFKVFRSFSFGGAKFTSTDAIKVGDEVVVYGQIMNYNGTPETVTNKSQLYSLNGQASGDNTGGTTTEPSGEGTASSPYNVAKALSIASGLEADKATDEVYIEGIVVGTPTLVETRNSSTYYISDDGTTTGQFQVYSGKSFGGANFTNDNLLKAGDKVVLVGQLVNFRGNRPQVNYNSRLISVNGKTDDNSGGDNGGEGTTGESMTKDLIVGGQTGSVALAERVYGSQSVSDENSWYTWKFNNITYKGARICISDGTNGEGIQMQGNATDAAKQGFLFNADAYTSDIKTVTLVMSIANTSKYDPSFNFYAGNAAHPMETSVTVGTPTKTVGETYTDCTYVIDLSGSSYKYFTLANNLVGALYIKSISVTLK